MTQSISGRCKNAFNCSLDYFSHKPQMLQKITQAALEEAQRVAKLGEHPGMVLIRSKAIVAKAFADFKALAKNNYPEPENDFFLQCSFQKDSTYFYSDLMSAVKKILNQQPVPKPIEASSLDEEIPVEV